MNATLERVNSTSPIANMKNSSIISHASAWIPLKRADWLRRRQVTLRTLIKSTFSVPLHVGAAQKKRQCMHRRGIMSVVSPFIWVILKPNSLFSALLTCGLKVGHRWPLFDAERKLTPRYHVITSISSFRRNAPWWWFVRSASDTSGTIVIFKLILKRLT